MFNVDDASAQIETALAPVADTAGRAAAVVRDAVVDTWRGFQGLPTVPGGTNWSCYSHEQMIGMLDTNANASQVGDQCHVIREMAGTALDTTEQISRESQNLSRDWQGLACERALRTLDEHHRGGTELTGFLESVTTALDLAAEALERAQCTMPPRVPVDQFVDVGEDIGKAVGVHLVGREVGRILGAGAGGFVARIADAHQKTQAVEVMRRYELDLQNAFSQITPPTIVPPGDGPPIREVRRQITSPSALVESTGSPTPGGMPSASASENTTRGEPAGPTSADLHPADPARGSTVSSASVAGTAARVGLDGRPVGTPIPWQDLIGRSALRVILPELLAAGRPGAEAPLSGRRGLAARNGMAGAAAVSGRGAGSLADWRKTGSVGHRPGTPTPVPPRGGGTAVMGGRGAGPVPGIGIPGAGRRGDQEAEHRNKMPRGDNLFAFDEPLLPPPVIGDWIGRD
jgi:uncharacterized protein YukE